MKKGMLGVIVICILLIGACKRGPKVISSSSNSASAATERSTGIFSDANDNGKIDVESHGPKVNANSASVVNNDVHTVVVKEVLPTEKYVYLNVTEDGEDFWIATGKQEVKVGETYHYHGGLLKRNFESKEYNRIFDKVYLVTNLVPNVHGENESAGIANVPMTNADNSGSKAPQNIVREGSVRIADLVENPEKYAGKSIQISGECVKINPNIMGRNWIHLRDGSKDAYDLVVTSNVPIPEGHVVTMKGTVALNKDFGAGYRYDIIIENGALIQ